LEANCDGFGSVEDQVSLQASFHRVDIAIVGQHPPLHRPVPSANVRGQSARHPSDILRCLESFQIHGQPSAGHQDKFSDSWKVATLAVTGTALLIVSRFVHLGSSLHGLLNIAGWFLIIACWSFPTSRAQSFAISGVCLIALCDIRWREFSVFGGLNIYVTIALLILWLTVSALTYLFLSRRKPTPSPQGLN
jgi:hypothetical protein